LCAFRGEYRDFGANGNNFRLVVDITPYMDLKSGSLAEESLEDIAIAAGTIDTSDTNTVDLRDPAPAPAAKTQDKARDLQAVNSLASYINSITAD
jgi:hypothetical protein